MSTRKSKTKRKSKVKSRKSVTRKEAAKIAQNVIDKQSEFQRRLDYIPVTAITSITSGHLLFDGPQIVSGHGGEERTGLQVRLRHLKFNLQFSYQGIPTKIRLIGVRYPQGSSSPSFSDLLTHFTTNALISPWVKDGDVKYSVWCNQIVSLGGDAEMATTYKNKQLKLTVKMPSDGVRLTYETGTTQPPDKNRYCLFAVANVLPALASDRPQIEGYVSTGFTDL